MRLSPACLLERLTSPLFRGIARAISVDATPVRALPASDPEVPTVYALPHADRLNHLLMNAVALQLDLPAAGTALDPSIANRPAWLDLLRSERIGDRRVRVVPVAIIWGPRPDRVQRTLADLVFGDLSRPSLLRRIFILVTRPRSIRFKFSTPLELKRLLERAGDDENLAAKKLRRLLASHLHRERGFIAFPPIRAHDRVVRALLADPDLKELVPSIARREKKQEAEVWARARKILDEMVADYSPSFVAICYRGFLWLWSRLYSGRHVDRAGLERLKETIRNHPAILMPSHKSHLDYLLLSAIFYEEDMLPPHIAAGINLAFWPIGGIFRRSGAYFIRRRISGDLLYARLLDTYVRWLIRAGHAQLLFIEGGRTRTGKTASPKHGLFSLQIDAFLESSSPDLYVIPVSVTYDRVTEDESYCAELRGGEKSRENFWILLKAGKLLRRKYGAGYVRFGAPISVREHFAGKSPAEIPAKERHARTLDLTLDAARSIASETTVTLPSLAATALLSRADREISVAAWFGRILRLREFLRSTGAPLSDRVSGFETQTDWLLNFFERNEWVRKAHGTAGHDGWILPEERRLGLDFYKNTILHNFLAPALAASADTELVGAILAHEFLLPDENSPASLLTRGRRWVEGDPDARSLFLGLLTNYLEAYDWAARYLTERNLGRAPLSKDHVLAALALGNRLADAGEITRREAVSTAQLKSAYAFFNENGLLENSGTLERWRERMRAELISEKAASA